MLNESAVKQSFQFTFTDITTQYEPLCVLSLKWSDIIWDWLNYSFIEPKVYVFIERTVLLFLILWEFDNSIFI